MVVTRILLLLTRKMLCSLTATKRDVDLKFPEGEEIVRMTKRSSIRADELEQPAGLSSLLSVKDCLDRHLAQIGDSIHDPVANPSPQEDRHYLANEVE